MDNFLSLLQFADGLFPAGAYAHSFGLESCVQSGQIRDAEGVEHFLRDYLEGCAAPTDAVALLCARRAAVKEDIASCIALDKKLDAVRNAQRVARRQPLDGRSANAARDHIRILSPRTSKNLPKPSPLKSLPAIMRLFSE